MRKKLTTIEKRVKINRMKDKDLISTIKHFQGKENNSKYFRELMAEAHVRFLKF